MHKNTQKTYKIPQLVKLRDTEVRVWPQDQKIHTLAEPTVHLTDFGDTGEYHDELTAKIQEFANNPRYADLLFKGGCGIKIRRLDEWPFATARLVHARAMSLCSRILKRHQLFVDDAWGNVYHNGDYCMPHSHLRATASVVYFLSLGDEDPNHPMSGRFCIGDPRSKACCQLESDRMTHSLIPDVRAGSMIIFPSQLVHFVNPYTGKAPRITLSWNINLEALKGRPEDAWHTRVSATRSQ